jgi:hypothetical protein
MQKQLLLPPEIMIEVLKSSRSTTPFQLEPGVNLSFQSARGRYDDLLSSALVHRSWTPISQQELFHKIAIFGTGNELLGRALEESPHLMNYLEDTVAIFIENRSYDLVMGIGSWVKSCRNVVEILLMGWILDFDMFGTLYRNTKFLVL